MQLSRPSKMMFAPRIDVQEEEGAIQVFADVPGVDRKDVKISLSPDRRTLSISGERKFERSDRDRGYFERSYGAFRRSVRLPRGVKTEEIKATFNNGVLNVMIPREPSTENKGLEIPIGDE